MSEHNAEVTSPWTGPATWTCSCGASGEAPSMTEATRALAAHKVATTCPDHKPVQHRDARPPWCRSCGKTADGSEPLRALRERKP